MRVATTSSTCLLVILPPSRNRTNEMSEHPDRKLRQAVAHPGPGQGTDQQAEFQVQASRVAGDDLVVEVPCVGCGVGLHDYSSLHPFALIDNARPSGNSK